jgi:hypothetical protein
MTQRLLPMLYYGECNYVKDLKKRRIPKKRIPEMLYDCFKMNRCAPCVLHEWVGDSSSEFQIDMAKKGDLNQGKL